MFCPACGANVAEGVKFCGECGAKIEEAANGEGRPVASLSATRIYTEEPPDLGVTRIYREKDTIKTVIYTPEEQRKPIFGWLVATGGKDAWKVFKITNEEGQFILGRGDECPLKLEDELVDIRHTSLRLKEGKLWITDLDSSTGTLVNNKEISKTELKDGDEIKAGGTILKFKKL